MASDNKLNDNNLSIISNLLKWRTRLSDKKLSILQSFLAQNIPKDELINYFLYDNLKSSFPDFCPLYADNTLCHSVKADKLNCYGCDCPYFDLSDSPYIDNGKALIGRCSAKSKKQKRGMLSESIYYQGKKLNCYVLDCSSCTIPHTMHSCKKFITKDINNMV